MNSSVLKDKKWLVSLVISMAFSITALTLAGLESGYWLPVLIISIFIPVYGAKRATKLTHGDKE